MALCPASSLASETEQCAVQSLDQAVPAGHCLCSTLKCVLLVILAPDSPTDHQRPAAVGCQPAANRAPWAWHTQQGRWALLRQLRQSVTSHVGACCIGQQFP